MISLRSLGECVIQIGSTTVTPEAQVVFATALYFAHHGGRPVSRRSLAALLWPDADDQHAAHCVRQALYRLRSLSVSFETGPAGLIISSDDIALDHAALAQLDHTAISDRVRAGTLEFLPTYAPTFSAPFATWVDDRRQIVHAAVRRRLSKAIAYLRASGRIGETEPFARACLALDPLNEEATLALAEALAVNGGRSEALGVLERYTSEIGRAAVKPASEVATLRRRIAESPTARRTSDPHRVPLIGRATELETVAAFTAPGATPAKRGCYVSGDPGIGKSRLVFEGAELAAIRGFHVETVRCQSLDAHRPLSLLFELVPRLRVLPGALGCDPTLAEYLQRLADTDLASKRPGEGDEPGAVRLGIQRAVVDLVDAVATESPLLIVVDDAHCLDPHSWRMLAAMLTHAPKGRVVVYLASRAAPGDVVGEDARAVLEALERVGLAPLSDQASLELLEATADGKEVMLRADVGVRCVRTGAGNPFYLLQLLDHALEGRPATTLPHQLKSLLDDRLARISSEALGVLQTIGILQNNATIERLDRVLQHPTHHLLAALTELESSALLTADGVVTRCRHDLLAEAAVSRLTPASRLLIETRVASILEAELQRDRRAAVLWDCAQHWRRAGNSSRGLALARECGLHLLSLGIVDEAVQLLGDAMAFCTNRVEELDLLELLRNAQRAAGLWREVHATAQRRIAVGVSCYGASFAHGDDEHLAIQARIRYSDDVTDLVPQLLACITDDGATCLHRLRSAILGVALADNSLDDRTGHEIYAAAARLVPLNDSERMEQDSLTMIYHSCIGDLRLAIDPAQRLLRMARQQMSHDERSLRLRWAAVPLKRAGLFDEARAVAEESFNESISDRRWWDATYTATFLTAMSVDYGQVDLAYRWFAELERCRAHVSDGGLDIEAKYLGAVLALLSNDLAGAAAFVEHIGSPHGAILRGRARVFSPIVELKRRRGTLTLDDPALRELRRGFDVARTRGDSDLAAVCLASALNTLGQHREAATMWHMYKNTWRRELHPLPWYALDLDAMIA